MTLDIDAYDAQSGCILLQEEPDKETSQSGIGHIRYEATNAYATRRNENLSSLYWRWNFSRHT